jgi:hypothetical protein
MLDVSTDIVRFIIDKAKEFHAKEGVVIPEPADSPSDDWALQVLANHRGDFSYQELRNTINDLEPDQQTQLVALMWLGRGDFAGDEWGEAVQEARGTWNARTAEYLIATPLLSDYLQEGLSMLGYSLEDDS